MADFQIGQGDTAPAISSQLTQNGTPVNLTGATVQFRMALAQAKVTVVNRAATITNANTGMVSYTWQAADTATPGNYVFQWVVTYSDGTIESFPNGDTKPTIEIAEGVGE